MKQWVVFLPGNTAAPSGNDQTGFFSQIRQGFCLHIPENRLAVCTDDVLNPAAGGFLQHRVRIPEFLPKTLCQCLPHCRLSAAGHANQNQVFHPAAERGIDLSDGFLRNGAPGEPFGAFLCLGNQHPKTVPGDQSPLFRFQ